MERSWSRLLLSLEALPASLLLRFGAIITVKKGFLNKNAATNSSSENARNKMDCKCAGKRGYGDKGRWVKYWARLGCWISPCSVSFSRGARFETYEPYISLIFQFFFRAAVNRGYGGPPVLSSRHLSINFLVLNIERFYFKDDVSLVFMDYVQYCSKFQHRL